MWRAQRPTSKATIFKLLILGVLIGTVALHVPFVYGDSPELPLRSLQLTDSRTSVNATYTLRFDIPNPEVLGSIKLQICANDPLLADPCVVPAGFDISSASLAVQSGETGFVVLPAGTDSNTIVLSRVPAMTTTTSVRYDFSSVLNPSSSGTYYGRLETFSSGDASGSDSDHGGLAFSIQSEVQISATVPPYLLFCAAVTIPTFDCADASGSYINFGSLSNLSTAKAQSQMLTATNADNGFQISVYGSTMTSGNNTISALPVADVSRPGVSQFGLNLVANTTPSIGENPTGTGSAAPLAGYNQPDFFKFASGDPIVSVAASDEYRKLTASYIVNIQKDQPIGVYVSTITYTCLANF